MANNYSKNSIKKETRGMKRSYMNRKRIGRKIGMIAGLLMLISVIGCICVGLAVGIGAYFSIVDSAPDISNISVTPTNYATFVYDDEGNQTAKLVSANSNRIPVTLEMIPVDMQHAFVAVEDARFYDHHGIDIQGIIRAGFLGVKNGSFSQGASTITQQLIKNSVYTDFIKETFAESVRRKIQEQYLAVQLEKKMSKDDILVDYLNVINLGHNTLGVQAASLRYFGKSVSELNLSECAVIAGITQNPSAYDPIVYPEANKKRRKKVLDDMLDQGWIDKSEYDNAIADNPYERIQQTDLNTTDNKVQSYFVDALTDQVLKDLVDDAGYTHAQAEILLYSGGLNVYSTQNEKIQKIADEEANNPSNYPGGTKWYLNYALSVQHSDGTVTNYSENSLQNWKIEQGKGKSLLFQEQDGADELINEYKTAVMQPGDKIVGEKKTMVAQPQISLTIMDQHTGAVLAMVGGRGDKTASRTLNRATGTMRQPGSTYKVLAAYAPALDAGGKTLATTYVDEPYQYSDGTPVRNWYGSSYRGTTTIRTAIQNSMNIIAVKTLTDITPQLGYEYLLNFGFTTLVDKEVINGQTFSDIQQTLALGGLTNGVKNIELNGAYACIANGGEYLEPKLYTKITDHNGNVILDADNTREKRRVIRPATAWLLTSAMRDVVTKGTGTMCNISATPAAGKTGTTNDENDVWFAGYTNYYTCSTWAGYDDNTNLVGSESNIAKLIWRNVMERVHEGYVSEDFAMPDDVEKTTLCSKSMLLPVAGLCSGSLVTEYFDKETLPTERCNESYHRKEIAAQQAGVYDAQQALENANATLQTASDVLAQAQATLDAANAGGDPSVIAQAQAIYDTANINYVTAVQQQAAAQQAYDEALAEAAIIEAEKEAEFNSNTGNNGNGNSDNPNRNNNPGNGNN